MNTSIRFAVAAVFSLAAGMSQAAPVELISNGSFETGDLTSWSTSGLGTVGTCPSQGRDWNVSSDPSATGCSLPGAPIDGAFAAYVMNDGGVDNTVYTLSQSFVVPVGLSSASLSWIDSSVSSYSGASRTLVVELLKGSTLLSTVSTYVVPFADGDTSWDSHLFDVSSVLAAQQGQTLTLRFSNQIPEVWTGPSGLGLDKASILATVVAVPEPDSLALLVAGAAVVGAWRRRRAVAA
jgi:hypothetical protein